MNLDDILNIFEHLRNEQTAVINKAIRLCIKLHSQNDRIATATKNNSMSFGLTNQKVIGTDSSTLTNDVFRSSVVDGNDVYLKSFAEPSQEKSGDVGVGYVNVVDLSESSCKRRKIEDARILAQSTPSRLESVSNSQGLTSACLESSQASPQASLSILDSPISNQPIHRQHQISTLHLTSSRHNSKRNHFSCCDLNNLQKSLTAPENENLAITSDSNDLDSLSDGNLSLFPLDESMTAYVNLQAGNSSSRVSNTSSDSLSDIELAVLFQPDGEAIENLSSTVVGNEELIQNTVIDVEYVSANTHHENTTGFLPRTSSKSPANESSFILSEIASMMFGYDNELDLLKTPNSKRVDTGGTGPSLKINNISSL